MTVKINSIEIKKAKINSDNVKAVNKFENYNEWLIKKWQEIADLLAEIIGVSAALIMKTENEYMEVFISSQSENNPYHVGDKEKWYGLYCETVIKTQNKLSVPNATRDKNWDKNPDIKRGMIAYLGFPLNFPDNSPFGTLCVLDNKERNFTSLNEKLIQQFKSVIELDLALMQSFKLKTSQLAATVMQEITKRNQAEAALRLANTYNRNLIETSLDPLVTIGPAGKILDVNNATEAATGYSRQELIGNDFSDYFTDPEKASSGYQQVFKEGSMHDYPLEIRHRDGHIIPVLYNASVYYDETGKVVGVFAAARDITNLKQAHELLAAKNRMLTSINKYTQVIAFSPPEELFATIATMLKEIFGAAEVFINVYDEDKAELVLRKSTLSEETNTWVKKKFGDKFVDVRTPVPQDKYDEIMKSSVGRVGSLHEATFGAISKSVGRIIEMFLGVGWFAGLALKYNERLVGTIMIAGKKGSPELEKEELLAYANVTASVLAQKHLEADLFQSENRFRSTFEQAAVGIAHVASSGHWLQVNQKFCNIVGYTCEELLQLTFRDITYPDDLDIDLKFVQKLLDGQIKTYAIEKRYICKDGSLVWINLTKSLVRKPSGDPDYFIIVVEDITNRKQAEKAINELNKTLELRVKQRTAELEAVNTELEAFSYSVSHDLRAPLRSIDGFSQALLEDYHDKLDEQGENYLQRVRSSTQRMGILIDDLLKLSRITRSKMKYEIIDLSAMAHLIIAEFYKIEPERQVEFVIMPDLKTRGDNHLLQVLLENLLSNAWKFTSKHSQARIEFGTTHIKGEQTFFVRDNGAGFDMTYVDKLFTPFQRLHSDREFPGTGIGLATVQRIINRHNGRIWAEAEIEKGATFYFTLDKIYN